MEVKEKIVPFPSYMKNKLEYYKNSNLDILYENGKIITLSLTNIEIIVPHIIIFKSNKKELKLLYYGDYEEDRNRFYTINLTEKISFNRLKEIVESIVNDSKNG